MRNERPLNGDDWWMGWSEPGQSAAPGKWLPANVPGNVRPDLARAGRIPDPFFADNNEHSRWVDRQEWWFRKEFDAVEKPGRAFLRFLGLDYHARIELNGKTLCEHVGMFSPVMVMTTPPPWVPEAGETALTVGAGTAKVSPVLDLLESTMP